MVNLYQILGLSYSATSDEIQAALERKQSNLDAKTVKAVTEWLLVENVRTRYDAKVRQEQPAFFQAAMVEGTTPATTVSLQKNETQETRQPQTAEEYYVPKLWNPTAAVIWAILFSPVFGAWLHAINWRELGEEKLAKQNMYFVWGVVALDLAIFFVLMFTDIQLPRFRLAAAIWAAWFAVLGKKQIDFVRNEVNNDYDKKKWGKPIGLAILAVFAYSAMILGLTYLLVIAGMIQLPTE